MNLLERVKKLLAEEKLDAILLSSVPNILYLTGFSHFSKDEREAFLLITKKNQYILTDGRYSHAVRTHIKDFQLEEISSHTPLKKLLSKIVKKEKLANVGIEETNLTVAEYKKLKPLFKKVHHITLHSLREIKSPQEITLIQNACTIGDKAFSFILTKLKPGITEKAIAFELEWFIKKEGADFSFPAIVAFAENAAVPHHKTGTKKLEDNMPVLLDFGVKYNEYCSDMTRTVFFCKATKKQKTIYHTVLAAQQKAIYYIEQQLKLYSSSDHAQRGNREVSPYTKHDSSRLRSNNNLEASEVDKVARDYIIFQNFPSIPHSLGHGIGLEVHETPHLSPKSKDVLKNGMVFSLEPGIYVPDFMGVRIEDLFTIQEGKLLHLTKSPKNLIEL